ncbi:MAG: hypothetical protein ACFFC1_21150, partial [Promethearchaeota archaeon]
HKIESNKKDYLINFLIIFGIFLFQFISFFPFVNETSALLAADPYYWTENVLYLNNYGLINTEIMGPKYPWGFVIYCSGNLLGFQDFGISYYFMKFSFFPFIMIYSLIMFSISQRLFKSKFATFFCLLLIISQSYFIYRVIQFISSSLAILLIFLSFVVLLTDIPNYFLGIILSTIFLTNPVYSFFFILALGIFYLIKMIISYKTYKIILKEIIQVMILSIICLIVYVYSVIVIYNQDLFTIIKSFIEGFNTGLSITLSSFIGSFQPYQLIIINILLEGLYVIFFSVLPVISIIFLIKNRKVTVNNDFNLFLIICVILVGIFVLILPHFLYSRLILIFYNRIAEAFLPSIVILAGYSLRWLSLLFKKIKEKINLTFFKNNRKTQRNNSKLRDSKRFYIIMCIGISLLMLNHFYARENVYIDYRWDDSIIDCIFYIQNNIEKESNIAINENDETFSPNNLLFDYELYLIPTNISLTFSEFINFTEGNSIEYLVINLSFYNENFTIEFQNSTSFYKLTSGNLSTDFNLYEVS